MRRAAIFALLFVAGCGTRCEYSLIGLKGPHTAIVLNSCTGAISLRSIPDDPQMEPKG